MHALRNVKIAMPVKGCMPGIQRKYFREFPMQDLLASRRGEAFHGKQKILHCLFSILREYNFVGIPRGCIVERQYKSFVNFGLEAGEEFSLPRNAGFEIAFFAVEAATLHRFFQKQWNSNLLFRPALQCARNLINFVQLLIF